MSAQVHSSLYIDIEVHAHGRNILGGNFSLVGVPSVGASGAIFGTVAVRLITLGRLGI